MPQRPLYVPTYNHDRGDSALDPCPICKELQDKNHAMTLFESGATRNNDAEKFDLEGFLSPAVLHAYGNYMHAHRKQADGQFRDSDNWQKGIPLAKYMKSIVRHTFDLWWMHRGGGPINPDTGQEHTAQELCCAILFNVMGYLKELIEPSEINR